MVKFRLGVVKPQTEYPGQEEGVGYKMLENYNSFRSLLLFSWVQWMPIGCVLDSCWMHIWFTLIVWSLDAHRMLTGCAQDANIVLTRCLSDAPWMLKGWSLDAHLMLIGCSLDAYWIRIGCVLDAYWMRIGCSLDAHWMLTGCSLDAHWMLIGCSLDAHWMLIGCSLMPLRFYFRAKAQGMLQEC